MQPSQTSQIYDFAIIGSGPSGGRIAHDLTLAGARCVMLEAGREWGAKTFPDNELDYSTQLFWGGGIEMSTDGHLGFLRARCLGGTSIVNQALLDRFDEDAWSDWRSRSGIGFFDVAQMEPHYVAAAGGLDINKVPPEFYNRNAKIFCQALEKKGYGWKALDRAQRDCKLEKGSDCMVCLGGCPRDSKQSSLVTTIATARARGLEVISQFEVHTLAYSPDETVVRGFRGAPEGGSDHGKPAEIRARRVVLAAGSLGNTGILLRSGFKSKLPALGQGFTCHPQLMTYALFDEPVDAHKGAFQAVKSDDKKLRAMGFKLENVYAPPIGTSMLMPGFGVEHHRLMKKFRHYASMEVALRDEATGQISVDGKGRLQINKSMTDVDLAKGRAGLELVKNFFASVGARQIIQCTQAFGLHLMGGCAIGSDARSSVVNPEFGIHDHPGLYAADSSVFPSAPGINPSYTIMALSSRAAQGILREVGR